MASSYPGALDTWTDKTDAVDDYLAAHINDLQNAVEAVQTELGTDPAGSLATLKLRLAKSISDAGNLNFASATTLTISSGGVTATQNYHLITTEGAAASDDLDTISGGVAGMVVFMKTSDSTKDVIIKHNTGNILCSGSADLTLSTNYDLAIMIYDGTLSKWVALALTASGALGAANTWTENNYFSAGMRHRVHALTTDTTISNDYYMVNVDASGAAVTITLPTAESIAGQTFIIRKSDSSANAVTIDGYSSETINGAATVAMTAQYTSYTIMSDGTNWMVV